MMRFLIITALVFVPSLAVAHPHVFLDAAVEFEFSDDALEGFWAEWKFDEFFTAMIAVDFRIPRNRSLTDEQIHVIEQNAFSNLVHYNYFTVVTADGRRHPVSRVERFSALFRGDRIVYRFFVPFRRPLARSWSEIKVMMFDETFFTDIVFRSDTPVSASGSRPIETEFGIEKNRDVEIEYSTADGFVDRPGAGYTGLAHPYQVRLAFRLP